MSAPLLDLDHEWHRQRAGLRLSAHGGSALRPPPLVAAGLDLDAAVEGRQVQLGGLVVIFGHFPVSLADFIALARARFHLGPEQAKELDPVLGTRFLALWAWLPTLRRDCYLELDRAVDEVSVWLVGPGAHDMDAVDPADEDLDEAFLAGLVLNGHAGWGGEQGLSRLREAFGPTPLLVSAQVAECLENRSQEPESALELARQAWPALSADDEVPWAALAERPEDDDGTHAFICVQLGRLALRLGLPRAARVLLRIGADAAPIALFDLGQACDGLGDLDGAEAAFGRYAGIRPQDPDAWRRLLFCRLRHRQPDHADECLRRYHAAGGSDEALVERWLHVVARGRAPAEERGRIAAFLISRLGRGVLLPGSENDPRRDVLVRRYAGDPDGAAAFCALTDALRQRAAEDLAPLPRADDLAALVVDVVLMTLPFLGPPHPRDHGLSGLVEAADGAVALWCAAPNVARVLDGRVPIPPARPLEALAAMAIDLWREPVDG